VSDRLSSSVGVDTTVHVSPASAKALGCTSVNSYTADVTVSSQRAHLNGFLHRCYNDERTNKVYLPMNRVNNDWLPVEAKAHQSWPPKKRN